MSLDRLGAASMSHREIAEIVKEKYKVQDWWCQTVTVGYERIKGLRARGQRRDGSYEATKSRTFNVPIDLLFDAWANAKTRKRWLERAVKVRTSTPPKSMRLDWPDGGIIAVGFVAKGKSKSSVALSHTKLPDRETANQLKAYWTERLALLNVVLNAQTTTTNDESRMASRDTGSAGKHPGQVEFATRHSQSGAASTGRAYLRDARHRRLRVHREGGTLRIDDCRDAIAARHFHRTVDDLAARFRRALGGGVGESGPARSAASTAAPASRRTCSSCRRK